MNKSAVLLAAISMNLFIIQGAAAHSADGAHRHGLGDYGADGAIDRSQLPAGIAERVSDRAIDLAQSPEFARARAGWEGEGDFVWQIHYQLEFRAQTDYLPTTSTHLAGVLDARPKNVGIAELGLYMTDAEAREFERRRELGGRIDDVVAELGEHDSVSEGEDPQYGPNFAGVWQDQKDGGAIVVALVNPLKADRAQLERIVGGGSNLRVIGVRYSWNEVDRYRDALLEAFKAKGLQASVRINSTSRGRMIEVVSPNPAEIAEAASIVAPADLLTVNEGPIDVEEGAPNTTHSEADQMPGLRIAIAGGWCTWGINGHTSSYNYLVTAGHCGGATYDDFVGWTNGLEIYQNNSFLLTPGSQYVYSINTEPYDMKRMSTPQADSNCYHSNGHCIKNIRWRALHNSWEVGSDLVCATLGNTGAYQCGFVVEENYSSTASGCEGSRWVRYDIDTSGGDSGSGLIGPVQSPGDTTIDAIHACGSGTSGFGNTAYDVKTQLGFDFNCASTAVTGRAASAWGACPTYNR